MNILNNNIGVENPPFIIAEMSGNHNKSIDLALSMVEEASKCGVHAIKLQTYTADTLTLNVDNDHFIINDKESIWNGQSMYSLYQKAFTPWEWHETIIKKAEECGIICFSTPFDETAVDFLEEIKVPAYKIGSFENNHTPLIEKVAKTEKPLILSTGMASISDIGNAVDIIKKFNDGNFALLKCTSNYPADPINSNVVTIPYLRSLFNCQVGLSDHTLGIGASIAAVAHGASIIEKHFVIDRSKGGVDSLFSLEPSEMRQLVDEARRAWQSLGKIHFGPTLSEKGSHSRRRSIYISEDIKIGETFTKNNLKIVRPGYGLAPKYYDIVLGRNSSRAIKAGTPLEWDFVK